MLNGAFEAGRAAGYVLAGGRSSRMGLNKALLPWRGTTLLAYVAGEVESAAGSVTIVGGDGIQPYRTVPDLLPGSGPLGGIASALADSRAEWNLIVACDMPGLHRSLLHSLLRAAAGDVIVPVTPDGRLQPLCAVWHKQAGPAVQDALSRGLRRVTDLVKLLRFHTVAVEDESLLANVNTPDDWARIAQP